MRDATNKLLAAVEEGALDKDVVLVTCLGFLSEQDVKDMIRANDWVFLLEQEDELDSDEEDDSSDD